MAWELLAIQIGLALISAGVAYALRDRELPESEENPWNPRDQFPQVSESTPIPVVFGTCLVAAPNVVHIGQWAALTEHTIVPGATEQLNITGGQAPRYRLDMIMALCVGPVDAIVRIDVGGKTLLGPEDLDRVGSGPAFGAAGGAFDLTGMDKDEVAEPNFFGDEPVPYGESGFYTGSDDGLAGTVWVASGWPTNTLPAAGDYAVPGPAGGEMVGAYPTDTLGHLRGICLVNLYGLEEASSLNFFRWKGGPFYHGTSGTIRTWRFIIERCTRRGFNDAQWYDTKARITTTLPDGAQFYDMNPAHIVHEILTDRAWGLGLDTDLIDDSDFQSAADLFVTEGAGMSLLWDRDSPYRDIVKEVERTTDSIVFFDERDGVWRIKPIREDYVVANLPVLDASNVVEVRDYVSPSAEDLPTSVGVVYWDHQVQRDRLYTVHDEAAIRARGRVITEVIRYPAVVSPSHAQKIAHRDLRNLSQPRANLSIEVMPSAAEDLRRGDAFRFTWSEYGVDSVFRVASIDYGTVADPVVTIDAIEDVFTDRETFYDPAGDSDHTNPVGDPVDCVPVIDEMPYWIWRRTPFQPVPLDDWLIDGDTTDPTWRSRAIVWAPRPVDANDQPRWDHLGYRVAEQLYDSAGASGFGPVSAGPTRPFAPVCEITAEVTRSDTSALDIASGAWGDAAVPVSVFHSSPFWSPRIGDLIRVTASSPTTSPTITFDDAGPPARKYDYSHLDTASHEFLLVVAIASDTEVLVMRGCLDTVVHESIPVQSALVVGHVPCTEYDGAEHLGEAWFTVAWDEFEGYHGASSIHEFDPTAGDPDNTVFSDIRALTIAASGPQSWGDGATNVTEHTKPEDNQANPATLQRAVRPLVPGAIRVIDDDVNAELRIECEARNRLSDFIVPGGIFNAELVGAPPDATRWEVDPESYSECWVFDGEVDPPELLEILFYDETEDAFVWSNADEEATHLSKNGTSRLFEDLWLCVLSNNRSDVSISKARPSYQFARFHLQREPEFGTLYDTLEEAQADVDGGTLSDGDFVRFQGTDGVLGDYDIVGKVDGGVITWQGVLPASAIGTSWAQGEQAGTGTVSRGTDANGHPYVEVTAAGGGGNFSSINEAVKFKAHTRVAAILDFECATAASDTLFEFVLTDGSAFTNRLIAYGIYSAGAWSWKIYDSSAATDSAVPMNGGSTAAYYATAIRHAAHLFIQPEGSAGPQGWARLEEDGAVDKSTAYKALGAYFDGYEDDTAPTLHPAFGVSNNATCKVTLRGLMAIREVPDYV